MKPIIIKREYLKFGFVPTLFQEFTCPICNSVIGAGPNYKPKFCAECGVKLDFDNIIFEQEERVNKENNHVH